MSDTAPNDEFLTADELFEYDDIVEETLSVPEWGNKKVRIRGLTLQQMAALANKATRRDPRTGQDVLDREMSVALTVIYGMVQPKLTLDAVDKLRFKSAAAVTRIVQAINALGPTQDAIDEAAKSPASELNGAVSVFPGARAGNDEE